METEEKCNYRIINLAYTCPLCMKNPHCPLKEIRTRQFDDKIAWFNSLSLLTKQTIHDYHLQCYLKHTRKRQEISLTDPAQQSDGPKKEEEVSAESKTLPVSYDKDFSFLKGSPKKLCKVKEYMFGSILCGESHTQGTCSHRYVIGENTFCSSPVRKEIYKKYQI